MKQLYIKTIISSALFVFSSLASANNINFKQEADKLISTELPTLRILYDNDPNKDSYLSFVNYIESNELPPYFSIEPNQYIPRPYNLIARPVNLVELSNSEVTFSNAASLNIYKEKIRFEYDYNEGIRREYLSSDGIGGMSFTASFSKPVSSANLDFKLADYLYPDAWGTAHSRAYSPYEKKFMESSTPILITATYKDALGHVIGTTSEMTPFDFNLIDGTGQLNNSGFSIGALKPFSSVDIFVDSGSLSNTGCIARDYHDCDMNYGPYGIITHSNLLVANNFSYTFATAAVPEPETYAMFFAGLVIIGSVANKRKRMS